MDNPTPSISTSSNSDNVQDYDTCPEDFESELDKVEKGQAELIDKWYLVAQDHEKRAPEIIAKHETLVLDLQNQMKLAAMGYKVTRLSLFDYLKKEFDRIVKDFDSKSDSLVKELHQMSIDLRKMGFARGRGIDVDIATHKHVTIALLVHLYTHDYHQFCAGVNRHVVRASVLHNEVLKKLENATPEERESAMTKMSTLSCNHFEIKPEFDTPTDTPIVGTNIYREDFENRIKRQNPWIRPEGDIYSWRMCNWIQMDRMGGAYWKPVPSKYFDLSIRSIDVDIYTPETCVAPELRYGEKLPRCFEDLFEGQGGKLDVSGDTHDITLDLRTFMPRCTRKKDDSAISLVSRNKKRSTILFKGDKITLEGYLEVSEISIKPFKTFIAVIIPRYDRNEPSASKTLVFSRKDKFHFKNSSPPEGWEYMELHTFGDQVALHDGRFSQWLIFDPLADSFKPYLTTKYRPMYPVACYEGVIWWMVTRQLYKMHMLIPTFKDLHHPGTVFYHENRAMVLSTDHIASRFQQCTSSRKWCRYITRTSVMGTQLVDLGDATVVNLRSSFLLNSDDFERLGYGKVTRGVRSCLKNNEISKNPGHVLVGLVEDKLYSRSISAETVSLYKAEGERKKWEWEASRWNEDEDDDE